MYTKKGFHIGIGILIALVVMGYGYLRARDLLYGPQITIRTPRSGETAEQSLVHIDAETKNINAITVNGRHVYVDEHGALHEETLLMYGYNVIEIRAKDKFGREVVKTLELVYK